jgi:hypothetical protein
VEVERGSWGAVGGSHTLDRTTTGPDLWDVRPHEGGGEEVREREKEGGGGAEVRWKGWGGGGGGGG